MFRSRQGLLRSYLCKPKVPADLEAYASRWTIIRNWQGVSLDLERKAVLSGKDADGADMATYVFLEPGTQNPEAFMVVRIEQGSVKAEISRSAAAELAVYRDGAPIVTFPPTALGSAIGYYLE